MSWKKDGTNAGCELDIHDLSIIIVPNVANALRSMSRRGVYAVLSFFILFSMLQFRDGPFIRPHPAFWRVVLGVNLLYELGMVFLLFQDLDTARHMMKYLDPNLGVSLPEKSYAENCDFSAMNIWVNSALSFKFICNYLT